MLDLYEKVKKIAKRLNESGYNEESIKLNASIDYGSTSTEILMAIRWNLSNFINLKKNGNKKIIKDIELVIKEINTVIMDGVNILEDIDLINSRKIAKINNTFTVNGRVYGIEPNNTLFPISGEGFITLDRGGFDTIGIYKKFGNSFTATKYLDNIGVPQSTRETVLKLLGL